MKLYDMWFLVSIDGDDQYMNTQAAKDLENLINELAK